MPLSYQKGCYYSKGCYQMKVLLHGTGFYIQDICSRRMCEVTSFGALLVLLHCCAWLMLQIAWYRGLSIVRKGFWVLCTVQFRWKEEWGRPLGESEDSRKVDRTVQCPTWGIQHLEILLEEGLCGGIFYYIYIYTSGTSHWGFYISICQTGEMKVSKAPKLQFLFDRPKSLRWPTCNLAHVEA